VGRSAAVDMTRPVAQITRVRLDGLRVQRISFVPGGNFVKWLILRPSVSVTWTYCRRPRIRSALHAIEQAWARPP